MCSCENDVIYFVLKKRDLKLWTEFILVMLAPSGRLLCAGK
jgi:hypothetical protein